MKTIILLAAIAQVESGGRDDATGDLNTRWPAIGRLQVRQPALTDANAQLAKEGKQGYALSEMRDKEKAEVVFLAYSRRYKATTFEDMARLWHRGPNKKRQMDKHGDAY